ncbi:PepSY domain-containing protein [Primorskyibacter sp. 2E233]|uniref:PepSY domain-containing protein n=1 Tax=Primorskyibacter sp. 2E233 TaxID=3413431 RepID=UPI003BF12FEF
MRSLLFISVLAVSVGGASGAFADEHCNVPMAGWQPREAVQSMAEAEGWTVRRIKIDDGCYEIDARDAAGREIEVTVDPETLEIMDFEYED